MFYTEYKYKHCIDICHVLLVYVGAQLTEKHLFIGLLMYVLKYVIENAAQTFVILYLALDKQAVNSKLYFWQRPMIGEIVKYFYFPGFICINKRIFIRNVFI